MEVQLTTFERRERTGHLRAMNHPVLTSEFGLNILIKSGDLRVPIVMDDDGFLKVQVIDGSRVVALLEVRIATATSA